MRALVLAVLFVIACEPVRRPPSQTTTGTTADTSSPARIEPSKPSTKQHHASHEHAHGAHPHPRDEHHHHPHPHPHLDGDNGHHHPY